MIRRLCCLALWLWLLPGCSTNNCQDLCEAYYQMELRCDLFGEQNDQLPAASLARNRAQNDPQTLRQQIDYAIRSCRHDFREPQDCELKNCCKSVCFQALVTDYDAITGRLEADYEQQRDLCRKFRQLARDGEAPWCTEAKASCVAEAEAKIDPTTSCDSTVQPLRYRAPRSSR